MGDLRGAIVADYPRIGPSTGRPPTSSTGIAAKLLRQGRGDLLGRIADAVTGDEVEIRSLGISDQVLGWSERRCR